MGIYYYSLVFDLGFHFFHFLFSRYDEQSNNCFDFALSFLSHFLPTSKKALQKQDFCRDFIVPLTTKAAQYIDLYRRIQQGGGVFVERTRWR